MTHLADGMSARAGFPSSLRARLDKKTHTEATMAWDAMMQASTVRTRPTETRRHAFRRAYKSGEEAAKRSRVSYTRLLRRYPRKPRPRRRMPAGAGTGTTAARS
jgi:hypothetical protein